MAPISSPSDILCDWMEWNVHEAETKKDNDGEGLYSLKLFAALDLLNKGRNQSNYHQKPISFPNSP